MSKTIEIKIPDIGGFDDVPVIEVMVKPGDAVQAEDSLLTLESDKATMDVPSPAAGTIKSVKVKVGDKIMEVVLTDIGPKVVASTRLAASVLPNASLLFPGGVVQNMLGNTFVSLFPQAGQTFQVRIPDLDAYRVIDARYDAGAKGGVLMVVGRTPKGIFDRLVFRFDGMFQTYDVRKVEDIGTPQGLNFVVTDAGMCICMDEDDKLELTSVNMGSSSVKTITDKMLGGDLRLFKRGGQVFMSRGDKVFSMRMR